MSNSKSSPHAEPRSPGQRSERELYREIGLSAVVAALCIVAKPVGAQEPAGPDPLSAVPALLVDGAAD